MSLDEILSVLDREADLVPPAHLTPDATLQRVHGRARRQRLTRRALAAAIVVAVVGAVAWIARPQTHSKLVVANDTTTTTVKRTITDEQLAAHDGVGVPSGWAPIDTGSARVFVPADWDVQGIGTCLQGTNAPGLIGDGEFFNAGCQAMSITLPAQTVYMIPLKQNVTGAFARVIHGYRVYAASDTRETGARAYAVPQLGVEISFRGTLGDTILNTLAPSSKAVALAFAKQSVPSGHVVTTDGISLSIPTSWSVTTPDSLWCSPPPPQLARIRVHILVPYCPLMSATAARKMHDGVQLYFDNKTFAPQQSGQPIAVLHHHDTTVRVYNEEGDASELDLFVQRDHSAIVHVLRLGLGREGRVAGGVLASIRALT